MKWTIAASQGDVIKALTQRIKDWWTIDIKGQTTNIDDEFEVSFGKTFKVFKVEELTSNHLVWRCMDSYIAAPGLQKTSEWKGTSIHWSINVIEGATQLDLIHEGLVPEFECYTICCQGWAHFGNSLVSLLEKNSGTPFAG
jgi:hypothetical protein